MSFDADFEARLRARLSPIARLGEDGDRTDVNLGADPGQPATDFAPAAVLVPVVRRPNGFSILLTQRTNDMPTHAGQVAFPGGRVQAEDDGFLAAALRETQEETGLTREFITPLGGFGAFRTGTFYRIVPVVALVEPGFELAPDPREVDSVFETPASFLMDASNHALHAREWKGARREYYAMPWNDRYIWGVTAGMIKALHQRLYEDDV
jgi:8-oxo-dGTP pyrophosphatase MutT (NUDIX family)